MAIYKNGELARAEKLEVKANPPAPVLTDVEMNKAVEDYISCAAKAVAAAPAPAVIAAITPVPVVTPPT